MTTSFEIDPNTRTIAAAWASSPLGRPDHETGLGFADPGEPLAEPAQNRRPVAKHAMVSLTVAGIIGAGAALGLMFGSFTPEMPTVVAPGGASPQPVVATAPDVGAPPSPAPETVVVPVPGDIPAPEAPAAETPQIPEPSPVPYPHPVPDDPKIEAPTPKPPVVLPDLPLAGLPQPTLEPKPAPKGPPVSDIAIGLGS
ncbi:hypothetical protein [Mycolicibacterium sp. HK-90]|uniref:hypothetical protein n=1 Tax=Mycolicibacterium sp. HK-90 TaxID=3056937 RepID=UPI00265AB6D9|nr:hypothetical protein [Mycolicibacterium sp. HK-90]WKG03334.1 hypothetical protein QU592_29865 [Mycolicibacterium sp. HK-90]